MRVFDVIPCRRIGEAFLLFQLCGGPSLTPPQTTSMLSSLPCAFGTTKQDFNRVPRGDLPRSSFHPRSDSLPLFLLFLFFLHDSKLERFVASNPSVVNVCVTLLETLTCTHTHVYALTQTHTRHRHTRVRACMHTQTHKHKQTHTYTLADTHTHIHTLPHTYTHS